MSVVRRLRELKHRGDVAGLRRYLSEKELLDYRKRLPELNAYFIRTYTIEPLIPFLELDFLLLGRNIKIEVSDYSPSNSIFFKAPTEQKLKFDIVVILWRLEDMYPNLVEEDQEVFGLTLGDNFNISEARDDIKRLLSVISEKCTCPLVISSFPSVHASDVLWWRTHFHSQKHSELNKLLIDELSPSSVIFDLATLLSGVGEDGFDQRLNLLASAPFKKKALLRISSELSSVVDYIHKPSIKVLAIDLDNTLWGGVLGEDGLSALSIASTGPSQVFWKIQAFAKGFREAGGILVLLSKNNITEVECAFSTLQMPLKLTDFTRIAANWSPKYENLEKILTDLNLGSSDVLFVDDQEFERSQMRAYFQDINILEANDGPTILSGLRNFKRLRPKAFTSEDTVRNADYENLILREESKKLFKSNTDFLVSLDLRVRLSKIDETNFNRCVQLINKTNQFNLTSRRYDFDSLNALLKNDRCVTLTADLSDKFGRQGLIGLAIAVERSIGMGILEIDNFLLSCRAIGRGVESIIWAKLAQLSLSEGYRTINALYVRSEKNSQVESLYDNLGLTLLESENDPKVKSYKWNLLDNQSPPEPHWITIESDISHI